VDKSCFIFGAAFLTLTYQNKKMKPKSLLFFIQLFFVTANFSQTYKAVYVCYLNKELSNPDIVIDAEKKNTLEKMLPQQTKIIYEVICNAKVQEIAAFLDSVETVLQVSANKTSLYTNIVSRTIYFPENGEFKKLIFHESDSLDAKEKKHFIKGYSSQYYYQVNPKLPFYINPGFFVKNSMGAITALFTPNFTIKLLSVKKIKTKLMVHPAFKKAGDLKKAAAYSLLE
jgi:hypothetical protein